MLKVAVLGLGKFGSTVAVSLSRGGAEVLAVDRTTKLVEAVADKVAVAVGFDATDVANLEAYDVSAMDAVVVAIGTNFEASVLVTMHCKALGVPTVYAKASNLMQESVLLQVGADHIIKPEEDMGARLAKHLLHESVVDFVELPAGFSLRRLPVPDDWHGRSLRELALLAERRLNLIQVVRGGSEAAAIPGESDKIPLPHGQIILYRGDQMDVIGPDKELDKLS
jgi:trk system potassium uptake protein TrkA